jgi:putative chitinase
MSHLLADRRDTITDGGDLVLLRRSPAASSAGPWPLEVDLMDLVRIIGAVAPRASAGTWAAALLVPMQSAGITTPNRISMFLGQLAEETGEFRDLSEDLNYTTAERIREVWPSHFADAGEAAPFVGRPQALANHVYANRMGNGVDETGDGWRFRGRGLIQVTGRTLYEMFARVEPRATDPDWLMTPPGAAASACWYWMLPGFRPSLNALADAWDVAAVTQRINGGLTNLPTRIAMANAARATFGLPPAPPPAPAQDQPTADSLMAAELATLNPPAG